MNLEWFHEEVTEELDGACNYIKVAIENKTMHPDWAKNLYSMSIQELDHATKIYSMMQEYYKGLVAAFPNGLPKYIETCMAESTTFYTEKYSKIKILQELFSK